MDVGSIGAAYEAVKATKDILKAVFDAKVDAQAEAKILQAQKNLGDVQDALFVLRERISTLQEERDGLKAQLAEANNWGAVKGEYDLSSCSGGAVVYKYHGQPEHFACPSCFNKREVHILQDRHVMAGLYHCPGCGADFPVKTPTRLSATIRNI